MLGVLIGKSLAVKVVAGFAAVTVAGTGVAAQAGALPAPVQRAAHDVAGGLGVPAPPDTAVEPTAHPDPGTAPSAASPASAEPSVSADPSASAEPGHGPDASGPAARGLCQAYRSDANGASVAQQALAQAAGGADKVAGYCDGVLADKDAKHGGGQTSPTGDGKKTRPTDDTDKNPGKGGGSDKGSDKGNGNGSDKGSGKNDKGSGKNKDG